MIIVPRLKVVLSLGLRLAIVLFRRIIAVDKTELVRLIIKRAIVLWVPFKQILLLPTFLKNIVFVLSFLNEHQFTTYISIRVIAMVVFEFLILNTLDTFVNSEWKCTKPHELWKDVLYFYRNVGYFIVQYFVKQLSVQMVQLDFHSSFGILFVNWLGSIETP